MLLANPDIRADAKGHKIPHWRIADKLGISDITFSRMLRHELSPEEKKRVMKAIREIAAEQEGTK